MKCIRCLENFEIARESFGQPALSPSPLCHSQLTPPGKLLPIQTFLEGRPSVIPVLRILFSVFSINTRGELCSRKICFDMARDSPLFDTANMKAAGTREF